MHGSSVLHAFLLTIGSSVLMADSVGESVLGQERPSKVDQQFPKKTAESLWNSHVSQLLSDNCQKCHQEGRTSGQLDLTTAAGFLRGGKRGPAVIPGKADESLVIKLVQHQAKPHMPPKGKKLSTEQVSMLKVWINRLDSDYLAKKQLESQEAVKPLQPNAENRSSDIPDWLPPAGVQPATVIDLLVEASWKRDKIEVAMAADDRQFVRRIYLDLLGRIPAADEVKKFLDDTRSQKRSILVDQLLSNPEHADYFASIWDTFLMGRGKPGQYQQRQSSGWVKFLKESWHENRPWNETVEKILLGRPESTADAGAVWFLYERKDRFQELAESISPAVFGVRIECAQCHDHPLADEIEQRHYWGLVAFFKRGKNIQTKKGPRVAESAIGGFEQFTDLSGTSYPNELVFLGKPVVAEARPTAGQKEKDQPDLYQQPKTPEAPRVPKFSRRQAFVDQVLKDHPLVAKSMVNRTWALLMGRGLVHPFDKMDSAHPPSHPDLLEWLSRDFESSGYDVRRLIRNIVLSKAYQLDSKRPRADSDPATFAWSLDKPLIAEAWTRSIAQLLRGSPQQHKQLLNSFRQYFPEVLPEENMTRLKQTMFLSNNESLNRFIQESRGANSMHARLRGLANHQERVRSLYRSALNREPDESEMEAGVNFLGKRKDQLDSAIDLLIWAVVTGAEFRINH